MPAVKGLVVALLTVLLLVGAAAARADLRSGIESLERGDYERAQHELQPLAEQGDAQAQYLLGIMYLNGLLEAPQPDAAAMWLRRAAEQGDVRAQSELARMYRTGHGVPQDHGEMVKWYRMAAERGDVGAQLFVADSYAYGFGVEPDVVQAYMWYEIAIRYWGALAVRARDVVAEKMTADQVAEAVRRAANWRQRQ